MIAAAALIVVTDEALAGPSIEQAVLQAERNCVREALEVFVLDGGRYWDRTSGPCRVKRGYGAYRSTICEPGYQLQQALGIT